MKKSPPERAISQNDKLLDLRTGQFLGLHFTVLACGQDILPISIFWRGLFSRSELFAIETSKVQFVLAFSQNPLMVILLTFSPPSMEELYHRKEVLNMTDLLEMNVPKEEQKEVKEFVTTLLMLSKEDRAILLFNANAFKVRMDIERARR